MVKAALIAGLLFSLGACTTTLPPAHAPTPLVPPHASADEATRARFVAAATAMLGQPYHWGGAAPGGFDCSGLVVYAAAGAGIHLPRTAAEQLTVGTPIPRRELRRGDLVFLHLTRKNLHVGIAIDAEHFVNAPAAGGRVRIDSLASPPYARGFLQARRVIADRMIDGHGRSAAKAGELPR